MSAPAGFEPAGSAGRTCISQKFPMAPSSGLRLAARPTPPVRVVDCCFPHCASPPHPLHHRPSRPGRIGLIEQAQRDDLDVGLARVAGEYGRGRSVSHRACAETGTTADALGVTRVSQLMHHTPEHRRTATVESCCGTTKGEHPRTPTNTSRRTHNPLVAGSSPARPTGEYHVTGGLCMAGGGESCCAFRSWMLSHKFRRDALELRFHTIEESMVFGRVTAEKLQSASQLVTRPRAVRSKTRCSMRSPPRATPPVATKPVATLLAPSVIVIASRTFARSRVGVSFFAGRRVPQRATSTRRATSY